MPASRAAGAATDSVRASSTASGWSVATQNHVGSRINPVGEAIRVQSGPRARESVRGEDGIDRIDHDQFGVVAQMHGQKGAVGMATSACCRSRGLNLLLGRSAVSV